MKLKYSVPAFLVAVFISVTVLPDPLFSQADFYRGKNHNDYSRQRSGRVGRSARKSYDAVLAETHSGESDCY